MFQVWKRVITPRNTGASVPVMPERARLMYMVPHPNFKRKRVVLPVSWSVDALAHEPIPKRIANFLQNPTTLPKRVLLGVIANVLEAIFPLGPAAFIPLEEEKEDRSLLEIQSQPHSTMENVPTWPDGRHKRVKTVVDNQLGMYWRKSVKIGAQYSESHHQEVKDMLV